MARLATWGFETGALATGAHADGYDAALGVAPTVSSSVSRSGANSLKCDTGAGAALVGGKRGNVSGDVTPTASATNYFRGYFRFDNLPTGTGVQLVQFGSGAGQVCSIRLTTGGKIQFWNNNSGTQIGSNSVETIVADATTWHRIEIAVTLNATPQATALEGRLNGVSVASTSGLTIGVTLASATWTYGWVSAGTPSANTVLYIDDCALNDSTGSDQNSWPGSGKVVLLVPTADSAGGTGWTLGTGTALGGNGFAAVDNKPPIGVANLAVGSDPKQIRNAASSANSNYDATMTTYTAAGISAGATINVIHPFCETAAPVSTSAKAGTVGVVSNPAIANVSLAAAPGTSGAFWQGNAAGTWPTGWKWSQGTATYAPSVTLGTAPVMRLTQVTASTRIAMACFMGMYVDYTPVDYVPRHGFVNHQNPGVF